MSSRLEIMSTENSDDGPKIVWTFPLVRMLTSRGGLISRQDGEATLGNNIQNARQKVRDRVEKRKQQVSSSSDTDDEDDELDGITNEIDQINRNRDLTFGQSDGEEADATVDIEEGVFVPVRTRIEVGDTVTWMNNDDRPHRVLSLDGDDFGSGRIEPDESYSHTFNREEAVIYIDPIAGRARMCGAVIVGNAELERDLPCEQDVDAQLFEEEVEYAEAGRSLSQAAQDKQDMESGF